MGTTHQTAEAAHRRRAIVTAFTAVAVAAVLGGCSSGGTTAAGTGTGAPPASSTSPGSGSSTGATATGTSSSSSPSASGTSSASPTSGTSPTSSAVGSSESGGGIPTCTASRIRTRVEAEPGGGAAGSVVVQVLATNTSSSVCVTRGYPGVSLTAPGTGKQLGAAADRDPGQTEPTMRLEPGKTAVALVKIAQASNFGCSQTKAAGFRIYLPGDRAAEFAPYPVEACTRITVHQLSVRPFNT